MVTQSFEVSVLSFALPSTTMALIHTFANNSIFSLQKAEFDIFTARPKKHMRPNHIFNTLVNTVRS